MRALEREFKSKSRGLKRAHERSRDLDRELNREHLKGNP